MNAKREVIFSCIMLGLALIAYSLIGTSTRVETIKKVAPTQMESRNWKIIRYEGWEYGSWNEHGGRVWYHVANLDNPTIQYRVRITLWGGELHYRYGGPEVLNRVSVDVKGDIK